MKRVLISDGRLTFNPASSTTVVTIVFEPWGFSKNKILADLDLACSDLKDCNHLFIGLALSKVFFGRRACFVFDCLKCKFPSATILHIDTMNDLANLGNKNL